VTKGNAVGGDAREEKEPERPPARREPRLPTTLQPLGLRCSKQPPRRRGGDRPCPAGSARPKALRSPAADRLALRRSCCGGAPLRPTRGCSAGGRTLLRPCGVCLAREVPLPALRPSSAPRSSASGLSAFVGPPAPSPPRGGSGASSGLLASVLRLLGASELYGRGPKGSTPRFPRSRHECAGSGLEKKSDNSSTTVSSVTASDEGAGQRGLDLDSSSS